MYSLGREGVGERSVPPMPLHRWVGHSTIHECLGTQSDVQFTIIKHPLSKFGLCHNKSVLTFVFKYSSQISVLAKNLILTGM